MARSLRLCFCLIAILLTTQSRAAITPEAARKLYADITPSLVAVQFTWEYEFGKIDFIGPGIVVGDDGLVMMSIAVLPPNFPDAQLTDFKLIIPQTDKDDEELDAIFQGRDERGNVAFVKAKEKRDWKPVKFVDKSVEIGEPVLSVGLMPKNAGYRSYFVEGVVAAKLRGEIHHVLVSGGGLAAVGSPVFNTNEEAIGFVNYSERDQQFLLHTSNPRRNQEINVAGAVSNPPHMYMPTSDFLQSLGDPPTPDKPVKMPWIGAPQLSGLRKDVAEVFGLENQPAVEVGDIIADAPAARGGLKVGMKIVKLNGEPLERGDEPDEVAQIMARKIQRMKIGDTVTFGVLEKKGEPIKDIKVTLEERPKRQNLARRDYFDDLGFSVRELVFEDTYYRHQPPDLKAVAVGLIKPSSAAANAKLTMNDLITQFNNTPVQSLDQFESDYKTFRKDRPKEAIVLVVLRPDGTTQTIRIEPPQ